MCEEMERKLKIKTELLFFKKNFNDIIVFIKKSKTQRYIVILVMLSIGMAFLNIVSSFYYGEVMDKALSQDNTNIIINMIFIYGFTKLSYLFIKFFSDLVSGKTKQVLIYEFRDITLNSLAEMDFEDYQYKKMGELIGKIQESTFNLADNIGLFLPEMIRRLLVATISLIVVFVISPILSIIFFILIITMLHLQIKGGFHSDRIMNEMIEKRNQRDALYYDLISHSKTIQIFGMEKQVEEWLSEKSNLFVKIFTKTMTWLATLFSPARVVNDLVLIIPCVIGCFLVYNSNLSFAEFVTLTSLISISAEELKGLDAIFANLPTLISNGNDLKKIWDSEKEIKGKQKILNLKKSVIELKNCDFRYKSSEKSILSNTNIAVNNNEKIAIVGENGSGKSTFMKILSGLYSNYEGSLEVWGQEIRDINKSEFIENIGYVHQDIHLFQETILYNIVIGNKNIKVDDVEKLMVSVNLEKFVNKLNVPLLEFERNISGGEKQRIMLCRILLKKPKLLLLDEATSAVDFKTERKINDLILSLKDTTVISILHKMYLTKFYDRILVFDHGSIVEDGNFEQLMEKKGKFYCMITEKGQSYDK